MEDFWTTAFFAAMASIATAGAYGESVRGLCAGVAVFFSLMCITYKMK